MKKTKLTLLLLVVAMLVLTLCACQQTYDVTFELGYDNKTEVKTYDKGAKVDFRLPAPITTSAAGSKTRL